jgi:hypothetical protein
MFFGSTGKNINNTRRGVENTENTDGGERCDVVLGLE